VDRKDRDDRLAIVAPDDGISRKPVTRRVPMIKVAAEAEEAAVRSDRGLNVRKSDQIIDKVGANTALCATAYRVLGQRDHAHLLRGD
jgi:hypothetical protein